MKLNDFKRKMTTTNGKMYMFKEYILWFFHCRKCNKNYDNSCVYCKAWQKMFMKK